MRKFGRTYLYVPRIIKDSLGTSFAILGGIQIVLGFLPTLDFFQPHWKAQLIRLVICYVFLSIIVCAFKEKFSRKKVELSIRGMKINVKEGDLLSTDIEGWKVIPFNEYFDTQVDDVYVAHTSLNGKFIDSLETDGVTCLRQITESESVGIIPGSQKYKLGTIKKFQRECTLLLALTHRDENYQAYITRPEYEEMLRHMWKELSRVYSGHPINIPLLGGGLTRFIDQERVSTEQLIDCILCTLNTSDVVFNTEEEFPIQIILTKKALESVDMYNLKKKVW